MYYIIVSDERRRATYIRNSLEDAAAKAGELKVAGAVKISLRDDNGEIVLPNEHGSFFVDLLSGKHAESDLRA